MPKIADELPDGLRPYHFHGFTDYELEGHEAKGDCPFCGRPKFSINVETGVAGCWGCPVLGEETEKGGLNPFSFLRVLHKLSFEDTSDYSEIQELWGLLYPDTLIHWEVCKSILDERWLVPGYDVNGNLRQLYSLRPQKRDGKWKKQLFPTPPKTLLGHALGGVNVYDEKCETVYICEGWKDGTSLWETLKACGPDQEGEHLKPVSSLERSLLAKASVLVVPGINTWFDLWGKLTVNKKVVICFDNDHPDEDEKGNKRSPSGWTYAEATTRKLTTSSETPPDSLKVLTWGSEGFLPSLPDGYDVYDALHSTGDDLLSRINALKELFAFIKPVPESWLQGKAKAKIKARSKSQQLTPEHCESYRKLVTVWKKAIRWRPDLDDVLSTMLSVCLSTEQLGDQLGLQVIGPPGIGKSQFCDGLLTSSKCHAVEHLTGFMSGWKDDTGEDFSLLARANRKTWITSEGNVLVTNPKFPEVMDQWRRIFDGKSATTYKNMKQDRVYTGLRTPWIISATPAFLENTNQAKLGDRFLRVWLPNPDQEERSAIQRRAGFTELRAVRVTSDGTPEGQIEEMLGAAYRLTGGYVDYLREYAEKLINQLHIEDEEHLIADCEYLGEYVAAFRARPAKGDDAEHEATKEMATRLTKQFVRFAICQTVVLNKRSPDKEVHRRLRRIAFDTGRGRSLDVAHVLQRAGHKGLPVKVITEALGMSGDSKVRTLLRYMRELKMVDYYQGSGVYWRLTKTSEEMLKKVGRPYFG